MSEEKLRKLGHGFYVDDNRALYGDDYHQKLMQAL
jgi:hypothetical protein